MSTLAEQIPAASQSDVVIYAELNKFTHTMDKSIINFTGVKESQYINAIFDTVHLCIVIVLNWSNLTKI